MKKLKDDIWLLGETPGSHHASGHYCLPGINKMTPMEGLEFFGIKNLCRMKMEVDKELSYLKDPFIVGDVMEKCCLSLIGSGGWGSAVDEKDDMDEILEAAREEKRIVAAVSDDFWCGERPLIYTPEVLKRQREKLHNALDRELEFWSVFYDRSFYGGDDVYAHAKEFDLTTYWVWYSENLPKLEEQLQWAKKLTKDGRVILGLYMWDYGNCKPIPDDLVKLQLDFAYEKYYAGEIEGIMLNGNCNADIGLSAADITKKWIDKL